MDAPGTWMIGGVNAAAVQLGNDFSNVYVDNAHEMVNMYGATYASVASGAGGTVQIGGGAVVVVTAGSVTINGGAVSETACANYVAIASSNGTVASGSAISLPTAAVAPTGGVAAVTTAGVHGFTIPTSATYDVSWTANAASAGSSQLALCVVGGSEFNQRHRQGAAPVPSRPSPARSWASQVRPPSSAGAPSWQ